MIKHRNALLAILISAVFTGPALADSFIGGSGNISSESNDNIQDNSSQQSDPNYMNPNTGNLQQSTPQQPAAPEAFQQGTDYYQIKPSIPSDSVRDVTIINFMTFGCETCIETKNKLDKWSNSAPYFVSVVNTPVAADMRFIMPVRAYFALKAINKADVAEKLLNESSKQTMDYMKYSVIKSWITKQNVNIPAFEKAFDSNDVIAIVSNSPRIVSQYHISSVPTIVVDGKYAVTYDTIQQQTKLNQLLTFLSNKVAKEKAIERNKDSAGG